MPTIVQVNKLQQDVMQAPAAFQRRPDGSAPTYIIWRAAFIDDTGASHYENVPYGLCETPRVDFVLTPSGQFDENGDALFTSQAIVLPLDCPEASALLAQGLVDEAVDADIARVKSDLEDPSKPQGVPL